MLCKDDRTKLLTVFLTFMQPNLRTTMSDQFITKGLSNETTHGTQDDGIGQSGAGRRPRETELAIEQVG